MRNIRYRTLRPFQRDGRDNDAYNRRAWRYTDLQLPQFYHQVCPLWAAAVLVLVLVVGRL